MRTRSARRRSSSRTGRSSRAYEVGRVLEEMGDKVPQDLKDRLTKMADELKALLPADDSALIKQKLDELEKTLLEIGRKVYERSRHSRPSSRHRHRMRRRGRAGPWR